MFISEGTIVVTEWGSVIFPIKGGAQFEPIPVYGDYQANILFLADMSAEVGDVRLGFTNASNEVLVDSLYKDYCIFTIK